jgi:hypothetical protein
MTDWKTEPARASTVIEVPPASRADPALAGFQHRFATVEGVRLHYIVVEPRRRHCSSFSRISGELVRVAEGHAAPC